MMNRPEKKVRLTRMLQHIVRHVIPSLFPDTRDVFVAVVGHLSMAGAGYEVEFRAVAKDLTPEPTILELLEFVPSIRQIQVIVNSGVGADKTPLGSTQPQPAMHVVVTFDDVRIKVEHLPVALDLHRPEHELLCAYAKRIGGCLVHVWENRQCTGGMDEILGAG